jgi:DNA-binding transcriptional LysR family regulator
MIMRPISPQDYQFFVAALDEGSLSAAGRELGISPAMASRRLARMEDLLGARLINRTTRKLEATVVGLEFYERAKIVLAAMRDAEGLVRRRTGAVKGRLRVSAPTTFGRVHVAPYIKSFLDAQPDLELELNLSDEYVDLVTNHVDVAIRIGIPPKGQFEVQHLALNRRVLCASPGYLERSGRPESLASLSRHKLLAAENQMKWHLSGPDGDVTLSPAPVVRTNSSEVVRELLLSGLGVALRSTWDVADELRSGTLERVLPGYRGVSSVSLFAVSLQSPVKAVNVEAFVRYLGGIYGETPYWDRNLHLA